MPRRKTPPQKPITPPTMATASRFEVQKESRRLLCCEIMVYFWRERFLSGVFLLGIVYLIFVCIRRIRKGLPPLALLWRPFLTLLTQTKMR